MYQTWSKALKTSFSGVMAQIMESFRMAENWIEVVCVVVDMECMLFNTETIIHEWHILFFYPENKVLIWNDTDEISHKPKTVKICV